MLASIEDFASLFTKSLESSVFVKLTLGDYQGTDNQLKNIYIREVRLKGELKLAFTYRYKTKDIVKNYVRETAIDLVNTYLQEGFKAATLFTVEQNVVLSIKKNGNILLRKEQPSLKQIPNQLHDKQKKRLIAATPDKQYLQSLGILDPSGKVYKHAGDKYKQINHYIELLRPLIAEAGMEHIKQIVDMGSGKGYLTFALYDYLQNVLKINDLSVKGVEFRQDLVDLCNRIALEAGFNSLHFEQGSIIDFKDNQIDLLIALHACDTATDDAIYRGIQAQAKLIVVAPCCHKQIRNEMELSKKSNEMEILTRFGIFLERQAEMLTDGIRALILEYFGYKTKVFEFISDAHTPKNVLIAAVKIPSISSSRKEQILTQLREIKNYFGISKHYLERLLDL